MLVNCSEKTLVYLVTTTITTVKSFIVQFYQCKWVYLISKISQVLIGLTIPNNTWQTWYWQISPGINKASHIPANTIPVSWRYHHNMVLTVFCLSVIITVPILAIFTKPSMLKDSASLAVQSTLLTVFKKVYFLGPKISNMKWIWSKDFGWIWTISMKCI